MEEVGVHAQFSGEHGAILIIHTRTTKKMLVGEMAMDAQRHFRRWRHHWR